MGKFAETKSPRSFVCLPSRGAPDAGRGVMPTFRPTPFIMSISILVARESALLDLLTGLWITGSRLTASGGDFLSV
jgi:hypothetical protein